MRSEDEIKGGNIGLGWTKLSAIEDPTEKAVSQKKLAAAINWVLNRSRDYVLLQAKMESRPEAPHGEWVASFGSSFGGTIGYVPQESGVDRFATGRENLALQGRIQGMGGRDLRGRGTCLAGRHRWATRCRWP